MIAVENILTRANYFNLSDPTVVLYWRAGGGLEISKRNRGIPPLVQAIRVTMSHLRVTIGHYREIIGHHRVIMGQLRLTIGYL